MKFIDLFAGVGGFHAALTNLGHECVFACEIDKTMNPLYKKNWGIEAATDIRKVKPENIPDHDILCAGFPCQPFSTATAQLARKGLECPKNGDLFFYIVTILMAKRPRFFILENVPALKGFDNGKAFNEIKKALKEIGYNFDYNICCPTDYGIPQHRPRLFIIGDRDHQPFFMNKPKLTGLDYKSVLEPEPVRSDYYLSDKEKQILDIWQEFWDLFKDYDLPQRVHAHEWKATYPYEDSCPANLEVGELQQYKGPYGESLEGKDLKEIKKIIPLYAFPITGKMPLLWIKIINENRCFYQQHKSVLDDWLPKLKGFPRSWGQLMFPKYKFDSLREGLLLFRRSGIHIAYRQSETPTILTDGGVIVGNLNRYLTPIECARLQSFPREIQLPETKAKAYKAVGNAVNIRVVEEVAKTLLEYALPDKEN